jgi:hypothetical protein
MTPLLSLRKLSLLSALVLFAGLFAGCFGSKFTLIPPEKAVVERKYVGDWDAVDANGNRTSIVIRNLDEKFFYVETSNPGRENVSRYAGFTATVKGATFAHLRTLSDDGSIPDTWLLMRVELSSEGKLFISQLDEEFFNDKTIESAEQLRDVIEKNVNAEAMYDKDETVTATRAVKQE